MSATHVSHKPRDYVAPRRLPVLELRSVLPLLPRLRCGHCGSGLQVEPPTWVPGRLVCSHCSREYNAIVDRLPAVGPFVDEPVRRGRPPGPSRADHSRCGPGMWCATCRTIRSRRRKAVAP